jgi:Copper binding proteins, plastocyanin/azurin family
MIAALMVALALSAGQAEAKSVKIAHWQPACVQRRTRRCRRAHRLRPTQLGSPPPTPGGPEPGPTPAPTPAPPRYPTRTSVDLTEWRVTPAYRVLGAGTVEFNAENLGEDDHDFSVRLDDTVLASVPLKTGESDTVRIVMAPGVYRLYCSLPDHEQLGMKADVTVR